MLTRDRARRERNQNNIFENLAIIVEGSEFQHESSISTSVETDSSIASTPPRMSTINKMNVWSKSGLDPAEPSFAKIYHETIRFRATDDDGEALKKFKLEPERFEEFRSLLTRQVNKMSMKKLMKVTQDEEEYLLLDQAQLVTEATIIAARDEIWDDSKDPVETMEQNSVNQIMDTRIKTHALGSWILDALSSDALHKLEPSKSKYMIEKDDEPYVHGPMLWWLIVEDIKPNNDTLIQNAKDRLMQLKVQDFEYSVKSMLTEFESIVVEIQSRLKGSITEDEQISALWRCLETMTEEKFAKIVFDEKRDYRNSTVAAKSSCTELIRLFKKEQTNMEADKIWNKPSEKDEKIIALTSILNSVVQSVNNAISTNSSGIAGGSGSHDDNPPNKRSKRSKGVPAWKYQNPEGLTECKQDGKTWFWCPKHNNPNDGVDGMWVRHKPEDHKSDFRPNSKPSSAPASAPSGSANSNDTQPSVTVDNNMFQALKSGADIQVFLNKLAQHNTTNLN